MGGTIRMRASLHDGLTEVRAIIRHPMEHGYGHDPDTGLPVPAHFIEEVLCRHGDKLVLRCEWSRAVSRNPYLSFAFTGAAPGDAFTLAWTDNRGESDSATVRIE